MYNDGPSWNHKSRSRKKEDFSKSWQFNYQIFSCGLNKKMNTHTFCFCPLIRKLQAFEILKWAQGSQWRKQRISNFTREIQLIFSLQWKYSFYIFTAAVKYSFFKICIIFNQCFSVFHYCVYNKFLNMTGKTCNQRPYYRSVVTDVYWPV